MIYLDDGYGVPEKSLAFFREHKHLLGEIESIAMTSYTLEIIYPFKIIGDVGEIWLSGCFAGYAGEGSHTTAPILTELGYPDDALQVVSENREFLLGPPNRWKPKPLIKNRTPRVAEESGEEILDFIKDYHAANKIMPTAKEIAAGCDSVSSVSMAHDRLHFLKDQGYIHIRYRQHRGIVLL